jgi:hypothetical protein
VIVLFWRSYAIWFETLQENTVNSSIFLNSSEPRNIMKIYSSVAKTDESVTMDENRPHMFVS